MNIAINMQFAFTNRSSPVRGKLLLNIHTVDIDANASFDYLGLINESAWTELQQWFNQISLDISISADWIFEGKHGRIYEYVFLLKTRIVIPTWKFREFSRRTQNNTDLATKFHFQELLNYFVRSSRLLNTEQYRGIFL